MKNDEKKLFIDLYNLRNNKTLFLAYILFIKHSELKRVHHILEKWVKKGFWNYGVTIQSGWFIEENIPDEYMKLVKEI